jgi:hypothetical protein
VGFNPPNNNICNYCGKMKVELLSLSVENDSEHIKVINRGKLLHEKCAKAAQQLQKLTQSQC